MDSVILEIFFTAIYMKLQAQNYSLAQPFPDQKPLEQTATKMYPIINPQFAPFNLQLYMKLDRDQTTTS
jgi:hypothetical protein